MQRCSRYGKSSEKITPSWTVTRTPVLTRCSQKEWKGQWSVSSCQKGKILALCVNIKGSSSPDMLLLSRGSCVCFSGLAFSSPPWDNVNWIIVIFSALGCSTWGANKKFTSLKSKVNTIPCVFWQHYTVTSCCLQGRQNSLLFSVIWLLWLLMTFVFLFAQLCHRGSSCCTPALCSRCL